MTSVFGDDVFEIELAVNYGNRGLSSALRRRKTPQSSCFNDRYVNSKRKTT
jgi:hypothetical protein